MPELSRLRVLYSPRNRAATQFGSVSKSQIRELITQYAYLGAKLLWAPGVIKSIQQQVVAIERNPSVDELAFATQWDGATNQAFLYKSKQFGLCALFMTERGSSNTVYTIRGEDTTVPADSIFVGFQLIPINNDYVDRCYKLGVRVDQVTLADLPTCYNGVLAL